MPINVIVSISDEVIRNLLCCAFEGGIGYWCQLKGYKYVKGITAKDFEEGGRLTIPDDYNPKYLLVPLVEGCSVELIDIEDDNKQYSLNLEALKRGLTNLAEKVPRQFGNMISGNDDASTGDCFVQCCLFGEVKYG